MQEIYEFVFAFVQFYHGVYVSENMCDGVGCNWLCR